MAKPTLTQEIRLILTDRFNEEELRNLCFDLDVDYDSLGGKGKGGKARELVAWAKRQDRLQELETAMHRGRPDLGTTYSPKRAQKLQTSILTASPPDIRDAFIEFTAQIDAYLNKFNLLHRQLKEWKDVHNLLQDLQNEFSYCRSFIFTIDKIEPEKALFQIEVEWRPCKRTLRKLEELATSIQAIGEPYQPESSSGPDWFLILHEIATEISDALFKDNVATLTDHLSNFGDQVDQHLYRADKALRDVVYNIDRLPRPGSYIVRSQ